VEHLDPDRLVLLALSDDDQADSGEAVHLVECDGCRRELDELRKVVDLGSEGEELRDLPRPPERIWHAIEAEIGAAAPITRLPVGRPRRDRRRWLTPALAAAAAAVIAVVGTVVITRAVQRGPAEQVLARATLSALPSVPPAAHGNVRVLADGELRIDVRNLPLTTGFHEVWLIDPADTTKMVSLGNLSTSSEALLPVPPGTDLNRYRLVDVSDEAHDGDAAHSGHSLLRGTLTS
jgi:anti-sigma-K factor RskA